MDGERRILLGRIVGHYGLRGELKLESWTDPRDAIFRYQPWTLGSGASAFSVVGATGRDSGKNVIARFPGVADRDQAQALIGLEISVARSQLPPPKPGEYYWVDLEGLEVVNREGVALGLVSHLFDTGANDVVVVRGEREHLIPFIKDHYVLSIDFEAGRIVVDWDPDF